MDPFDIMYNEYYTILNYPSNNNNNDKNDTNKGLCFNIKHNIKKMLAYCKCITPPS